MNRQTTLDPVDERALITAILAVALLLVALTACQEEGSGGLAGTGSAGGNPLTLSFGHDPRTTREALTWGTPVISIGQVRLARPAADTPCDFEGAVSIEVDQTVPFDQVTELLFDPPYPCGIALVPQADTPLLAVEAAVDQSKTVRVEIWADEGMRITIDEPARLEQSQDVYFILGLDRLLDSIEFRQRLASEDSVTFSNRPSASPATSAQVGANFINAARIYLDPTPGDGELSEAERTSENVIGRALLLPN